MSNSLQENSLARRSPRITSYPVLWALIWFGVIMVTQIPAEFSSASNAANGCPVLDFHDECSSIGGRILVDLACAACLAPLAWAIDLGFRDGWNWFARRNIDLPISSAARSFRLLIRKGILSGFVEAIFFGVPVVLCLGLWFNSNYPSDCDTAIIDGPSRFIQAVGVIAAYFAACIISACTAFPTNEEAIQ